MRKPFLLKISLLVCLLALLAAAALIPSPALAAAGDLIWEKTYDDPTGLYDYARGVAIDSSGVYIVGSESLPSYDYQWRVEKRGLSDGNLIWVKTVTPSGSDDIIATGVAVDSSGVYVVGTDNSPGNSQWRIEKRNLSDGSPIWTQTYNPTGVYDAPSDVAIDNTGIYIVGYENWTTNSNVRWRIEKRSLSDGSLTWSQTPPLGTYIDIARGVAVDTTGIYVVGEAYCQNLNDYCQWRIEKRSLSNGTLMWGQTINYASSNYSDLPYSVAVDSTGIYVAGTSSDGPSDYNQWRVEKWSISGSLIWAQTYYPGAFGAVADDIVIDGTDIVVVGASQGNWRVEKRASSDGVLTWEKIVDLSSVSESPVDIAVDDSGVYVVGSFKPPVSKTDWRVEKRCKDDSCSGPPPPLPTVNLSALPATIESGQSSTLSWTTTDATACDDVPLPEWISGPVGASGSEVEWPTATTTYTISCTGPGGTTQQSTTVTVNPPCTPGWTLTTVDSTNTVGSMNSIAIGSDGLPVISYFDGTNGDLKVAKCGNADCTSGNTLTTVDSTAALTGYYTSIAIGADGLPVIFYYDWTNSKFKVAKCGNLACSSGNTITILVPQPPFGFYNSIAIGADGLPIISSDTNASRVLNVSKCGNAACTSGNTLTTVDSTGIVGYYNSIVIGTDGFPVISYLDSSNSGLKVAKCGDPACTSGNTFTIVDSTGSAGARTSIAIGADGLPVISYIDWTNFDLKVAKCGDATCTSGNTLTTIDSASHVDYDTSIAIGTDGLPVISYLDTNPNYDIKVAKCGNATCTAGNTLTTVDSAGTIGAYHSIAIGADGLPVISYFDQTNGDLKVAKEDNCGATPPPTVTLDAVPSTINSGDSSTLTWTSIDAASCAAVSPAGWTAKTTVNDSELVTNITATTTYIIACTGPGGTSQQSATVTVSGGGGGGCGVQVYDGTATINISCENPPVSPLRIQKDATTTYGIQLVDPADPNASKVRIQTPSGVKALRRQ